MCMHITVVTPLADACTFTFKRFIKHPSFSRIRKLIRSQKTVWTTVFICLKIKIIMEPATKRVSRYDFWNYQLYSKILALWRFLKHVLCFSNGIKIKETYPRTNEWINPVGYWKTFQWANIHKCHYDHSSSF